MSIGLFAILGVSYLPCFLFRFLSLSGRLHALDIKIRRN